MSRLLCAVPDSRELEATRQRLSGHLVATPIFGDVRLPGFPAVPDLRIKAETLQCSGGIWFRGAMHTLARHFGGQKGVVVEGTPRVAYAGAYAAALQRVPACALVDGVGWSADWARLFAALDVECEVLDGDAKMLDACAIEHSLALGFDRLGGLGVTDGVVDRHYHNGIATVGLELARELPADTERVFVAPAVLAAPIERGLRAGGRDGCRVHGIDAHGERAADLAAAVRLGLRIDSDAIALAALAHVIAHRDDLGPNPCVLLSS